MMDTRYWHIRATLNELLAVSLRYPEMPLAQAVSDGEWLEAVREVAQAAGLTVTLPTEGQAATLCGGSPDAETLLHVLRTEATRLFIGAPSPVVSPYEGVWRANAEGAQALLFVNPHSMGVERFCKACGLGYAEGVNEPLDHIATEFELAQTLAMMAAGMVEVGASTVSPENLPGGSAQAAYTQFTREHLCAWANRFAQALELQTRLPFYQCVARLVAAYVATEAA